MSKETGTHTTLGAQGAATRISLDWSLLPGSTTRLLLVANVVIVAMQGASAGDTFFLQLAQDATGSRTVTWPANVKWPSGSAPTLSGASKVDILWFFYDGINFYGFSHGLNY